MFAQAFVRNALLAGSLIGLASGLIGYFVVLRGELFAGDALSHVAFTGALGAAALGLDLRVGLFAATVAVALLFAVLGSRARADDATIGIVFAWVLGVGVLFLDFFNAGSGGGSGVTAARTLFGSIFGLSGGSAAVAALIGAAVAAALLAIARPLLFATLDPLVAGVRGVPSRALGAGFLVLLGIDAAEATQAVGALLLLGLLAAPAGAAHRLTADPWRALGLSAVFAVASVWGGVTLAYAVPSLPPSTAIIGVAAALYAAAWWQPWRVGTGSRVRGLRESEREPARR
jgi:zinc/manganese transport system permease protein